MSFTAHPLPVSATAHVPSLPSSEIPCLAEGWLLDGEYRQLSPETLKSRRLVVRKLAEWLQRNSHDACGPNELRAFLADVVAGKVAANPNRRNSDRRNRPVTGATYYSRLHSFFEWTLEEGYAEASPLSRVKPPVYRTDQMQPFTEQQVHDLLRAARKTRAARRDEAILLFLLDTAVRASELCSLRYRSVSMSARQAVVMGKGNKQRSVFFSPTTAKALWRYLREKERQPDDRLFLADDGTPFTRSGLRQLLRRLGRTAGIQAVRCSPHTVRHTAAILFLRGGGNPFALQSLLGHTSLAMTRRYVAVAEADVERQHALYSPVEAISRSR